MTSGAALIWDERFRQVAREGYTLNHDADEHAGGQLVAAAISYATPVNERDVPDDVACRDGDIPQSWPWHPRDWKPTPGDRVRELVKAGALIAAEIDRLMTADAHRRQRAGGPIGDVLDRPLPVKLDTDSLAVDTQVIAVSQVEPPYLLVDDHGVRTVVDVDDDGVDLRHLDDDGPALHPKPGDVLSSVPEDQVPVGTIVHWPEDDYDPPAFYQLLDGYKSGPVWGWFPLNSVGTSPYRCPRATITCWGKS